jgi:hypothetical protein
MAAEDDHGTLDGVRGQLARIEHHASAPERLLAATVADVLAGEAEGRALSRPDAVIRPPGAVLTPGGRSALRAATRGRSG